MIYTKPLYFLRIYKEQISMCLVKEKSHLLNLDNASILNEGKEVEGKHASRKYFFLNSTNTRFDWVTWLRTVGKVALWKMANKWSSTF